MKRITKGVFLLFLLMLFTGFIWTGVAGYQSTFDFFFSSFHLQPHAEKISAILTPAKFKLLQKLVVAVILILSGVFYYFDDLYKSVSFYVSELSKAFYRCMKCVFTSEGKYALILPFLASVYFAVTMPVSYDEAWTYLNFTSKGPFASASYYPAPNNHILHSLLTNATAWMPLPNLLCMRLPVIIINALTWCIGYAFLKNAFNARVAVVIVSISAMLFMSIYYSYMSRGYALISLCFICAFYAAHRIAGNKQESGKEWAVYVISGILGLYTMPSFLYPLMTLNVFLFLSDYKRFKKLSVVNLLIFITSGLMYLPVMLISGVDAIINNTYVTPIPRTQVVRQLPSFFANALQELTGIPFWIAIVLVALAVIVLMIRKEKGLMLVCSVFLVLPFLLLLLHSVIPFSRTFVYYHFLLTFIIVVPFKEQLLKLRPMYVIFVLFIIQCGLLINFYRKIQVYEEYNLTSHTVVQQIQGNKKYVCNDRLFDALLLFELKTKGYKDWQFRYYNFVEMNADTVKGADFTIIGKEVDKTLYTPARITTKYVTVY